MHMKLDTLFRRVVRPDRSLRADHIQNIHHFLTFVTVIDKLSLKREPCARNDRLLHTFGKIVLALLHKFLAADAVGFVCDIELEKQRLVRNIHRFRSEDLTADDDIVNLSLRKHIKLPHRNDGCLDRTSAQNGARPVFEFRRLLSRRIRLIFKRLLFDTAHHLAHPVFLPLGYFYSARRAAGTVTG